MSKYYVNKFLYQVDRDHQVLGAYKADPAALVERWEGEYGRWLGAGNRVEQTSWLSSTEDERIALIDHDYAKLFELGAHFFLTLTIFIAIYNYDYEVKAGPLAFQREYPQKLSHWVGHDYPTVAL